MCAISSRRYNIKNIFKSFVALFMVAVLGIGWSVPAMAAECEAIDTKLEVVSTTEMESRVGAQVGGMSGKCTIKAGSVIGACYVGTGAKTIEVTITGVKGIIILQFDNLDTGDKRTFTAIGGQLEHRLEYASILNSGDWRCTVLMCDNNASNCSFDINFYR